MLKKKKKVIIINPPINQTDTVYSSVPLLLGQIRDFDIDSTSLDMNIEFFYDLISKNNLLKTEQKLKKIYRDNEKIITNNQNTALYKEAFEQNKFIEKYYLKEKKLFQSVLKKADILLPEYMNCYRNNNEDKNFDLIKKYIRYIIRLSFLPYYPTSVRNSFDEGLISHVDNLYDYSYENIMKVISDRKHNPFIDYFEQKIKDLKLNQYDIIGVSVPFSETLYPALTLCRLLKEKTKAKIISGGVLVHFVRDSFIKYPDMFGRVFDALMYGECEAAFTEYISSVLKNKSLSEINGLIYKENNELRINPPKDIENIEEIKNYCFDGIDFSKYFNRLIYVEFSKGCYWGKCAYCYSKYNKKYYIRDPKKAVDMLQELSEKYKVSNFGIIDDALSPAFAEKFADEIIKRNLKISYGCLMRLEKDISFELLKKLKQSGLYTVFWGLESVSERLLNLINKGINISEAQRIIQESYQAGIKNFVGIMLKFPTETQEEMMMTIEFVNKNKEFIDKIVAFRFTLFKYSALLNNPEYYRITNIREPEEFSNYLEYDAPSVSDEFIKKILSENNIPEIEIYSKWD